MRACPCIDLDFISSCVFIYEVSDGHVLFNYYVFFIFLSLRVFVVNCKSCIAVELLLYAPTHPVVDVSVVFLWMMAIGTIFCASRWSEFTASEQTDERYNELSPKVFSIQPFIYCPTIN